MGEYEETPIFLIYVIKRREFPRDTLGIWKSKGQCNTKVTLELYICNFLIWERGQNFSCHAFSWSINESRLFSSFSLVLWVVRGGSVYCWFYFILFIAICGLFSYALSNVDNFECNMCCELLPSACQTVRWLLN